ncbi:MAG: M67 family metallopeptidase [Anaerolineae bacterium]|nr:M67 family metallopeptidase [Anaerolineae bacterium]
MGLKLSASTLKEMKEHVIRSLPEEACGLLGGRGDVVETVLPVTNMLHSATRFEMEPAEQLKAFLYLEERQMDLVGIYHSHPKGPEVPSDTDIAHFYYPGVVSLIWSYNGVEWKVRAFDICEKGYKEVLLVFEYA